MNIIKTASLYKRREDQPEFTTSNNTKEDLVFRIFYTILYPKSVLLADDLEPQHGFPSKIQFYTKKFIKEYKSSQQEYSIYTEENFNKLIDKILYIILSKKHHPFVKMRALFALEILEKSVPELETLHSIAAKFLNVVSNEEYRTSLRSFRKRGILQTKPAVIPYSVSSSGKIYEFLFPMQRKQRDSFNRAEIELFRHQAIFYGHIGKRDCFFRNLQQIAQIEQIPTLLSLSSKITWFRDPFIFNTDNNQLVAPSRIGESNEYNISEIASEIFGIKESSLLGAVADNKRTEELIKQKIQHTETPFYFEGGNLVPAINSSGDKVYLSGAENIIFSLLNWGKTFNSKPMREALLRKISQLTENNAERSFIAIFEKIKRTHFFSKAFSDEDLKIVSKYLHIGIDCIVESMEKHLGSKIVVIGDVFEAPPEFHLDMYLMPAPGGQIFIQSHELCSRVLRTVYECSQASYSEKEQILKYLSEADARNRREIEKYRLITKQLEQANFNVISIPGVYYSENKLAVNYLNSIVGIGPHGTYSITNGSYHSVDRFLKEAYSIALNSQGISRIYFTGKREIVPAGESDLYRDIKYYFDRMGGIHCKTQTFPKLVELYARDDSIDDTAAEESISFDTATLQSFDELIRLYREKIVN